MRKPAFGICENKDAKLISAFVFATYNVDSTIPLLPKYEIKSLAILCDCTACCVWDLVGNPEDRFSHNEAHISVIS